MAWIYQVAFLFTSQIIETEGGKNVLQLSYFSLFLIRKRGSVPIWNWLPMISFHILDKLEVHVAGWGTTSGLSENSGVCRNLVILNPRCCCADSDY